MKKSKNKKGIGVEMHQHIDEQGRIFGAAHPIVAEHNNKKTQKFHDQTIKRV